MDLRKLIRDVLAVSALPDPRDVAAEVLARIEPTDTLDALEQAVVSVVRNEVSLSRMRHGAPDDQTSSAHTGQRAPVKSTKVAAIREHWHRMLAQRYPAAPGTWKFLGEFTAVELRYAAGIRRDAGDANYAVADRLETLAKALDDAAAPAVSALPPEVLRSAFGE